MELIVKFVPVFLVFAFSALALVLLVLIRKRPLRHCGGASFRFRGEKIPCLGCPNKDKCEREKEGGLVDNECAGSDALEEIR